MDRRLDASEADDSLIMYGGSGGDWTARHTAEGVSPCDASDSFSGRGRRENVLTDEMIITIIIIIIFSFKKEKKKKKSDQSAVLRHLDI